MANNRRPKVLSVVVADYVRTRGPVGSEALIEHYRLGIPPVTVRNDMAALEDENHIHQPHASAGRVPTQRSYRFFVDEVTHIKPLSAPERAAITALLLGAASLEQVAARAVRTLAQPISQLAVVEYPSLRYVAFQHLEFMVLRPECVLLVIVTDTGHVDQRIVTLRSRGFVSACHDGGFDIVDVVDSLVLRRLCAQFNGALTGCHTADIAPILAALAKQTLADECLLLEAVSDELVAALHPDVEEWPVVAETAGSARTTPDFSSLGSLLGAVEEQVVLLHLFTASNGAPAGENRIRVSIGSENSDDALAETSVVTTTYGPGTGEAVAHLEVIGPTCMDYPVTMTVVRVVARCLSRFLLPPET